MDSTQQYLLMDKLDLAKLILCLAQAGRRTSYSIRTLVIKQKQGTN